MFDNDYAEWEEICEEDECDPADDFFDTLDDVDDELEFKWIEFAFLGMDDTYEGDPYDVEGIDEFEDDEMEEEKKGGSYWEVTAPLTERQCDFAGVCYPCSFRVRIPEDKEDILSVLEYWLDEICPGGSDWLSGLPWEAKGSYKTPEMYIRIAKLEEAMKKDKRDEHEISLVTNYGWAEPYQEMLKKELQRYGI